MNDAVERFHARGRAAVLAGEEIYDVPPGPSSPRWGLSVLLRPDEHAADRLAEVAGDVAAFAGPHHWQTGSRGASHLTVCDLEPYREGVTAEDRAVRRYAGVLSRVAAARSRVRFDVAGLLLAPGGVLARALPADHAAATLRVAVLTGLGDDATYQRDYRGDRWWATLVHFAGPVANRAGLVDWVEARRDQELGPITSDHLELVRYEHDGVRTVPVALARFALTGEG